MTAAVVKVSMVDWAQSLRSDDRSAACLGVRFGLWL